MGGFKPEVQMLRVRHASREQPGHNQQHQRSSDLRNHQSAAQAMMARSDGASTLVTKEKSKITGRLAWILMEPSKPLNHWPRNIPATPPMSARRRLSVSRERISRARVPPRAARIAISRWRTVPRTRRMLATLTQARRRTKAARERNKLEAARNGPAAAGAGRARRSG